LPVLLKLIAQIARRFFRLACLDQRRCILARQGARQRETLTRLIGLLQGLLHHRRALARRQLDLKRQPGEHLGAVAAAARRRKRALAWAHGGLRLVEPALSCGEIALPQREKSKTILRADLLLAVRQSRLRFERSLDIAAALRALILQHAGAGARQVEFDIIDSLFLGRFADARLDIGDTFAGQRVAAKICGNFAIQTVGALQPLEECDHAGRVVSARAHDLETDPVGLAL